MEDNRLMLKSPNNTTVFSLAGGKDARKCWNSVREGSDVE